MSAHSVRNTVLFRLPHERPLIAGRLVARWDRFIADIQLDEGAMVRAHCVNPGRMEGQVEPGRRVYVHEVASPTRKLRYTWELIEDVDERGRAVLTGANTSAPNRIVREALTARALPGFKRFRSLRSEVKDGPRRLDFLLEGLTPHFVEVKNCHLVYPDRRAYFPDTVSERATAHVEHLVDLLEQGNRCSVLFIVQRPDRLKALRPSRLHDPAFADACARASSAGVRFRAFQVRPTLSAYEVLSAVPVDVRPYDPAGQSGWRAAGLELSGWKRSKRGAKPIA